MDKTVIRSEQLEEIFIRHVNESPNGIKGPELLTLVIKDCHKSMVPFDSDLIHVLNELVAEGKFQEREYSDIDIPFRIKSMYFPN